MSGRGLTSWRSAANAPDDDQDAITIIGAFVSCNGGLARRVCMASDAVAVFYNIEVGEPKVGAQLEGQRHRTITNVDR